VIRVRRRQPGEPLISVGFDDASEAMIAEASKLCEAAGLPPGTFRRVVIGALVAMAAIGIWVVVRIVLAICGVWI
jgi:hypothetical protein